MKAVLCVLTLVVVDGYLPGGGLRRSMRLKAVQTFEPRDLGAMECLFLPRRTLESCKLPPTVHVCCGVLSRSLSDAEALERAKGIVKKHALLRAKVSGDGKPPKRGPLGAPLEDSELKHVLTPFGDDNMRVGRPEAPLKFEPMLSEDVASLAMEPTSEGDWRAGFATAVDGRHPSLLFGGDEEKGSFDFDKANGPLWRFKLYRGQEETVILFGFDHAISDQPSAMAVLNDFVSSSSNDIAEGCPPSLEHAILESQGGPSRGFVSEDTGGTGLLALDKGSAKYLWSKAWGERDCVAPLEAALRSEAPPRARERKSLFTWREIDGDLIASLRERARQEDTTVGGALAAAVASAFAQHAGLQTTADQYLKVLQSLDMRRFGSFDDASKLACHAGSMDLVLPTNAGFWANARTSTSQLKSFLDSGFGVDSVRVFDWATDAMEMTRLVELEADNPNTAGRAYACGISNAGVFTSPPSDDLTVKSAYYATSTAFAGAAFQTYALTLDGALRACFSTVIGDQAQLDAYADNFEAALRTSVTDEVPSPPKLAIPTNAYGYAALGTLLGVAPHLNAWASFFEVVGRAVDGVGGQLSQLIAPFGFWLFFAVMHPLVGGAGVALGELAWQFPGYIPSSGDLDAVGPPLAFSAVLLGASAAIGATKVGRALAAFLATLWFSAYVTAGVAGTTSDLGSYNLALDDSKYPAGPSVLRGCPSYEQVADPNVAKIFDARKYQGTWYEHAYHDWTQFSEVYDTALDISLDASEKTWLDIFRVKGPSPQSAPHSWRGSPVAEGAAYPLYGTLADVKKPALDELGFGNYFPNYVIDLQTDSNGEYTEAIQFQCLDAGGVRIFEGINFLSRNPEMPDLDAMFRRAAKLAPYGATPDQMHVIDHNIPPLSPIDNWWQRAWKFIGFDTLLELIAKDL